MGDLPGRLHHISMSNRAHQTVVDRAINRSDIPDFDTISEAERGPFSGLNDLDEGHACY